MMIFGSECTHYDEGAAQCCGAPARWAHYDRRGKQILNVLCDAHRTTTSTLIPDDAERAAPSGYLLKRPRLALVRETTDDR